MSRNEISAFQPRSPSPASASMVSLLNASLDEKDPLPNSILTPQAFSSSVKVFRALAAMKREREHTKDGFEAVVGDRSDGKLQVVVVSSGKKRREWLAEHEVPRAMVSEYRAEKRRREERAAELSKRPAHLAAVPATIVPAPLLSASQRTPGFGARIAELATRLAEAVAAEEAAEKQDNKQATSTSVPIGVAEFLHVGRDDAAVMRMRMKAEAEDALGIDDCVWLVRKLEDGREEVVIGQVAAFARTSRDDASCSLSVFVPGGVLPENPKAATWRILKGDSWPTYAIQREAIRDLRTQTCMSMALQEALVAPAGSVETFAGTAPTAMNGWALPKPDEILPLLKRIGCEFNKSQLRAFEYVVSRSLSVVQGPPGTGKSYFATWVVAALIAFNAGHDCGGPILVTCESNYAVDNFLEMLQKRGVKNVIRVASSRAKLSESARQVALQEKEGVTYKERRLDKEAQIRRAAVVLCTNASASQLARLQFPIHIVDEAATSSLQSALVGMVRGNAMLVLLGDHKQLPPFTRLPDKTFELENKSFFEEMTSKGVRATSEFFFLLLFNCLFC